jgi:MraZ protein
MFTGSYARSLDEKLRIAIPKPLREELGKEDGGVLYVAPGTDKSLALYTVERLKGLAERLDQASPTAKDVREFRRLFYARAQKAELDTQGRIRIPPELAQGAELGRDVVLIGVHDHMEIWDKSRWEEFLTTRQSQYDDIAEKAFSARGE